MDNLKEALKWYESFGVGPDEYDGYVDYGVLARRALSGKTIPKYRATSWTDAVLQVDPDQIYLNENDIDDIEDFKLKKELQEIV